MCGTEQLPSMWREQSQAISDEPCKSLLLLPLHWPVAFPGMVTLQIPVWGPAKLQGLLSLSLGAVSLQTHGFNRQVHVCYRCTKLVCFPL